MKPQPVKPSFASIIYRKPKPTSDSSLSTNVDTVILNNHDLIRVDDSLTVHLMKLKYVDSMSNMYMICRNEGFVDLKRHHFGRLWIWIQFPTPLSCSKFQENSSLKSIYSSIESASLSFKVDEHMIWVKISGLPRCAWGFNAFKKVVCMFEDENNSTHSSNYGVSSDLSRPPRALENSVGDCFMVNIYGPQDSANKLTLWNRLTYFMRHHNDSFILFGELNVVRNNQERLGSIFSRLEVVYFNSFIDSTSLVDLLIGARLYTWMNKADTKLSKLDRFLISEDDLDAIPDIRITTLDWLWSDHNPILFYFIKLDFGLTPFKLNNSWLSRYSFHYLIKSKWTKLEGNINGKSLKCHEKFHSLKTEIKQRNTSKLCTGLKSKKHCQVKPSLFRRLAWPQKEEKVIKVDFKKSFDLVSWKYLDYVLVSLGFGSKWCSWIRACLNLSRASMLVNGSPTSEYFIKQGLRQEDPLSHFLFIVVMEDLHSEPLPHRSSSYSHQGGSREVMALAFVFRRTFGYVPSITLDKTLPRKVNIFICRMILDRLPHRLNLSSRGIDISTISCPSCNSNVESSNHISLSVTPLRRFGDLFVIGVVSFFLLLLLMSI
uniref:RNA-directed DNA polymerase, eukaryota n=1 Tax=Tanacetum cinerariifolium TaxID=118510 RepID=A0A6L2MHZ3_TANCI|nr:RNA-directed DNA polymerase, eukaryota [Tanacetum cinerariifolium]